jgi:hypothetical protein
MNTLNVKSCLFQMKQNQILYLNGYLTIKLSIFYKESRK